jgi:capsular exopolysaccharide synthesis family protein
MDPNRPSQKFDPVRILSQAFSYVKHFRLMLVMIALALLSGIGYFLYSTPIYQARSLVFFQSFGNPVRNAELPETSAFAAGVNRALIQRLQSRQVLVATGERLGFIDVGSTYEDFLEHVPAISVSFLDARHLEVMVQAYDPEIVRIFSATLIDVFQEIQEESWKEFRDEALVRYQVQLTELEQKVAENIDALTTVERDQKFTEVSIEQQNLLEIPKQLVETRERLTRMDELRKNLDAYEQDGSRNDTITILSLLSNFEKESEVTVGKVFKRPLAGTRNGVGTVERGDIQVVTPADVETLEPWRELERELRTLESRIQESSVLLLPEHPQMKEMARQLETVTRALETEMRVLREKFDLDYKHLTEKLAILQERIPEYQEVTEQFGRTSLEYTTIEQAQMMWDKARERLAEKLAAATFTEDFDSVQLRFKGHTSLRDEDPISPNKRKLVTLSLLLGLVGAVGLPTVLNLLDSSASSLSQLEDYIGLKGIGIVPLTDPGFLEEVHRSPAQGATVPNYLLECFRIIRANIGLDSNFEGIKSQVILVTSARPQEGKTTQSANLAWAYHSMGERVLLIDCDLRRGRQHALIKLDNESGMSRMLTGDISPNEAIIPPDGGAGFDVIPRGPIIPGSTELLCQDGFFKLVKKWRTQYDRIILDCPPTLGLSESSSLQRLADGIVMVVLSEKTSMKDVRDAVTLLRKTGAHFFGFVLNGVDLSKIGNYYQYYYYSAPYYDQLEGESEKFPVPSPVVDEHAVSLPPRRDSPELPSAVPTTPLLVDEPPFSVPLFSGRSSGLLPRPRTQVTDKGAAHRAISSPSDPGSI